jgi:hypothetical protein
MLVKSKSEVEDVKAMGACGVVEVDFVSFLTSGLGGVRGQVHAPVVLSQRNGFW